MRDRAFKNYKQKGENAEKSPPLILRVIGILIGEIQPDKTNKEVQNSRF